MQTTVKFCMHPKDSGCACLSCQLKCVPYWILAIHVRCTLTWPSICALLPPTQRGLQQKGWDWDSSASCILTLAVSFCTPHNKEYWLQVTGQHFCLFVFYQQQFVTLFDKHLNNLFIANVIVILPSNNMLIQQPVHQNGLAEKIIYGSGEMNSVVRSRWSSRSSTQQVKKLTY